jgi:hypothetical protein
MLVGNQDYRWPAVKEVLRIVGDYPTRKQLATVEGYQGFSAQPALWYIAARSAYREFDYQLAIDIAQRALKALNVGIDRLPQTTDPDRISDSLQKSNFRPPDLRRV